MKWGSVTWSNALASYDDHVGAETLPRPDRPMSWHEVTFLPLSEREPKGPPPHPDRVRVIVSVDYRRAVDWCRRYDVPPPPHRGSPFVITRRDDVDRMRGYDFYEDDEMIVLGSVDPRIVEEAEHHMAFRKRLKRPVPT